MSATRMRTTIAAMVMWAGSVATGEAPPVRVTGLSLGLGGQYKTGSWAPVLVDLDARPDGFTGTMALGMADSDDATAVASRKVHVGAGAAGGPRRVMGYVKPGVCFAELNLTLEGLDGEVAARYKFDSDNGLSTGLRQDQQLIVVVGRAVGLSELLSREEYTETHTVARLRHVEALPRRWYGYDAADWIVWTTGSDRTVSTILRRMGEDQKTALVQWVRRGGRLVLSVARQWQEVNQSFLSELLPEPLAHLEPSVEVDGPPANFGTRDGLACAVLRSYHVTNPRLVVKPVHWRIRSDVDGVPLAVSYPVGFGEVTLLCFDVDRAPQGQPAGLQNFWKKLLSVELRTGADASGRMPGRISGTVVTDLGSVLKTNLDHFEAVKPIPFNLVALLSFVYVLLIGPVDYLLLKKVFRRMELTWVTFTVMVVSVSALAYYVAYAVKGGQMRVNQIDVIDVNVADRTVRGTSWFTVFCPQNDRLDLSIDRPDATMGWLGRPESGFGGMYRRRSSAMLRGEYVYGPKAASLVGVPVAIWSTKSVMARWYEPWRQQFASQLVTRPGGFAARGTVTNRWGADVQDAVVAYARRVYFVGRLRRGQTVALQSLRSRDLSAWLERRVGGPGTGTGRAGDQFDPTEATTDPDRIVRLMMFYQRVPQRYLTQPGEPLIANAQFRRIDLSGHLDHGQAILMGRVASGGPQLTIAGWDQPQIRRHTYVRAILPVAKGAPTP